MGSGGGGSQGSGEVSYPEWFENNCISAFHGMEYWICDHHEEMLLAPPVDFHDLQRDNPYTLVNAYDPTQPISRMRTYVDDAIEAVEKRAFDGDYTEMHNIAEGLIEGSDILSDGAISEYVNKHERRTRPAFLRALAGFNASMAEAGATMSSAFVIGRSLMENEYARMTDEFAAKLDVEMINIRTDYLKHSTNIMAQILLNHVNQVYAGATLAIQTAQVEMSERRIEVDKNVLLNHKERHWPLELYLYMAQVTSSVSGGTGVASQSWENSSSNSSGIGMVGNVLSAASVISAANSNRQSGVSAATGGGV